MDKQASIKSTKDIQRIIKGLGLPNKRGNYVIHGSGPLFAHGLRKNINDLDILAKPKIWNKLAKKYGIIKNPNGDPKIFIKSKDHEVEIYKNWTTGSNERKMLKRSDKIDGSYYANVEDVLAWKKGMGREKDLPDIKNMEAYLKSGKIKRKVMNKQAFLEETYNSAFNDELEKVALSPRLMQGLAADLQINMGLLKHTGPKSGIPSMSEPKKLKKYLQSVIKFVQSNRGRAGTVAGKKERQGFKRFHERIRTKLKSKYMNEPGGGPFAKPSPHQNIFRKFSLKDNKGNYMWSEGY